MNSRWINFILAFTTVISGFYGGIGFFTFMGGNPAVSRLSIRGFAEYWQQLDFFMSARMPVFGITLLVAVVMSTLLLSRKKHALSALLFFIAFLFLVGDFAFTMLVNHPLNVEIQSWNLNQLPSHATDIQERVVYAFAMRLWLMIGSFVLVVAGVFSLKGLRSLHSTEPVKPGFSYK